MRIASNNYITSKRTKLVKLNNRRGNYLVKSIAQSKAAT
jgi:hypothetical protein